MLLSGLEYIGKLLPEERKLIEKIRNLPEEKQQEIFTRVEKRFKELNAAEAENLNNK